MLSTTALRLASRRIVRQQTRNICKRNFSSGNNAKKPASDAQNVKAKAKEKPMSDDEFKRLILELGQQMRSIFWIVCSGGTASLVGIHFLQNL